MKEVKASNEAISLRQDATNKHLQVLVAAKGMETEELDKYLPFPDNATIYKFLSNTDGKLSERKFALIQIILTAVPTNNNMKHFADALCRAIFTRNYIASYKWPVPA